MTIAVYPATFDPIHYGHVDIARRAAAIFDRVIVAAYARPSKDLMFPIEERLELIRETFRSDGNISIASYDTLTPVFARSVGAAVIIRGLRVVSDFELEFKMALMWRHLVADVDVCCFITSSEFAYVSSSLLKEVAMLGSSIEKLVPAHVAAAMRAKLSRMGSEAHQQVKIVSLTND